MTSHTDGLPKSNAKNLFELQIEQQTVLVRSE